MEYIIPLLLVHIQELNNQIKFLLLFIAKNIPLRTKPSDWNSPKYNKLKVDKLPIIKTSEKKNYKILLNQYLVNNGKPLKPIQTRGKHPVPKYEKLLAENNVKHSYSKKGYPYDNASMESFNAILKKEEVNVNTYNTFEEAKLAIFEFIESWYNNNRIHSSIDYKTPNEKYKEYMENVV